MKGWFHFLIPAALVTLAGFWLHAGHGSLPATGPLFDPVKGFMAQAEGTRPPVPDQIDLDGTDGPVHIYYDERLVPHIFAESEQDLYFAQGYVTAGLRLWQMEMTSLASSGRLSEKLGERFISYDRFQRRIGMVENARHAMASLPDDDPSKLAIQAYARGVNAWISGLSYKDYPLEYKLMGFEPSEWTELNTYLLLQYMSNTLTGYDDDAAFTNLKQVLGKDLYDLMYPERWAISDPIIPAGTSWSNPGPSAPDNPVSSAEISLYEEMPFQRSGEDQSGIGSNNWALSGSMTNTGKPILCNDPHLPLNLPSLWFEVQLVAPGMNVYGVSLPGSPCVIIGFNESVAWGVTNAGWDVRDWYRITTSPEHPGKYAYEGGWEDLLMRVETIHVKGGEDVLDTVWSSHHGPMVYLDLDSAHQSWNDLAMHWSAAEGGGELRTFYQLNKAGNAEDYRKALEWFACPAQNIVFASDQDDIAITVTGKLPLKYQGQGRNILDGSKASDDWKGFIGFADNPWILNPDRGFVSSANQHPTDTLYPYYYTGFDFEYFRNHRINELLRSLDQAGVDDMMAIQQDVYNSNAAEALPVMLQSVSKDDLTKADGFWLDKLKDWDYMNDPESELPTLFEIWWKTFSNLLWDEVADRDNIDLTMPKPPVTIAALQWPDDMPIFDNRSTPETETRTIILQHALQKAVAEMDSLEALGNDATAWYKYKGTTVLHMAQLLPFSRPDVFVGGNRGIVNATTHTNGPSWRMIVSLGDTPSAKAVYPGGQSGNPGSRYYDNFIDDWAAGKYYDLQYFRSAEEASAHAMLHLTIE